MALPTRRQRLRRGRARYRRGEMASQPSHPIVTTRMVIMSVAVGVVLSVASVPVGVLIGQARQTPPFPAPVIRVTLDRGDYGVRIDRHDSFGYEIWNAWNVRFRPNRQLPSHFKMTSHDPRPEYAAIASDDPDLWVMCIRAGWPLHAAQGRSWSTTTSNNEQFLPEPVPFGRDWTLPVGPIWLGLLGNTIFFAAITLALLVGLRLVRTRRRRARGRCVACNYELGEGIGVCPECGLAGTTDA
ncbi:hypothetical protein AY599_07345 [Leptolyngbya valderiana BDU 20041]|nr:hypothetical protein AY599_07345 [Leptolyngbya valderiana BDU 20041]